MDDLKEKTADLADHVEDMANTFYKLAIVNLTQKATNLASGFLGIVSVTVLGFFVLGFLGIAFAWWMGDLLQNRTLGFLMGAAFFLVVLLIILAMRKNIIYPLIRNRIVKKIYD